MQGSYSLKKVLPAMVSGFSQAYADLALGGGVSGGGEASTLFLQLLQSKDVTDDGKDKEEDRQRVRRHLVEYCTLDTLALVEILEQLYIACDLLRSSADQR